MQQNDQASFYSAVWLFFVYIEIVYNIGIPGVYPKIKSLFVEFKVKLCSNVCSL